MPDFDDGTYCTHTIYMDDEYICQITGEACNITPTPNQYICRTHDKYKYDMMKMKNERRY